MKNITITWYLTILLFSSLYANGQHKNVEVGYIGGFDSLSKAINKSLLSTSFEIEKDYLLFFEVSLNSNGKTKTVKPLHSVHDGICEKVNDAISKTSRWINMTQTSQKIIIPVFLIKDIEGSNNDKNVYYTVTSKDYKESDGFVKCFFVSPIIINFYHQKN